MKNTFIITIIIMAIMSLYCCADDDKDSKDDTTNRLEVAIEAPSTMPYAGTAIIIDRSSKKLGDVTSLFGANAQTSFAFDVSTGEIIWKSAKPFVAQSFFLQSSEDEEEKDPSFCILYGSIDGMTWKTLDVVNDLKFKSRSEIKEFDLNVDFSYLYYKILLRSSSSVVKLSKWGIKNKESSEEGEKLVSVRISEKSTMPSHGTISVQYADSPTDSGIENIVSLDDNTSFVTSHQKVWMEWKNDYPFVGNNYFITSSMNHNKEALFNWVLSVSNDGKKWIEVDEQQDQSFSVPKERKQYLFDNKALEGYTYYRISLSTTDESGVNLSQWGISASYDDSEIVRTKGKRFKHSDKTPMGVIYEKCKVTDQSDIDWLLDANNEPKLIEGLNATWKEWSVNLYPFGTPLPSDINQRSIGDCSGIAALAALAYAHPEFIQSIIKEENGGTAYSVAMYDPQGKPITVRVSNKFLINDDGGIAQVTSKKPQACWSTILEKAVMKYNTRYKMDEIGQFYIGGIGSDAVFTLFSGTGDSYAFDEGSLTPLEMKTVVLASLSRGDCVTGFYTKAIKFNGTEAVLGHGFTVTLSPTANDLFSMRNPWGNNPNQPKYDGLCNIAADGEITPTVILCVLKIGKIPFQGVYNPYTPPSF